MRTARPLIPRRTLFDNPTFFGAKISPDGWWISWLAPVDGVLNVWMAPVSDVKAGEPVTRTKGRPINWQDWSADGRFLMFLNDETGDENHHLFVVDPVTRAMRDLTPLASVSVQLSLRSQDAPGDVAVKINDRDARWHDLYRIDLATGQRTLIWENTQQLGHIGLDWHLRPRHARSNAPDGGSMRWRIEGTTLRPWFDVPYEDNITTWVSHFNRSNERVLLGTSIGRDTAACFWHDWATGQETLIAEHPKADTSHLVLHPTTTRSMPWVSPPPDRSGYTSLPASPPTLPSSGRGSPASSSALKARRTTIAAGLSWPIRRSSPPPTFCWIATSSLLPNCSALARHSCPTSSRRCIPSRRRRATGSISSPI
jgi:acylaminoacyl-peptidase